jgi:hypothetical protein
MKLKTLKNKYALAYPLLALGFALSSCSQEDVDNNLPANDSQRKNITFTANPVTAETKGITTKVIVSEGQSSGYDRLSWEDNEKISFSFVGDNYKKHKEFVVSVQDGGVASITGSIPEDEDVYKIRALSPYNASYFPNMGNTVITIPAEQTRVAGDNHYSKFIYLYAQPDATISVDAESNATGSDIDLDFDLLTSLLRFEIENATENPITITSVKISFPSESSADLYGRQILNDKGTLSSPSLNPIHTNGMTLNFGDLSVASEGFGVGYMSIFPTTSASELHIDLTVKNSDGLESPISYKLTDARQFVQGNRYVIPLLVCADYLRDFETIEYAGYEWTSSTYAPDHVSHQTINNNIFFTLPSDPSTVCPAGFDIPTLEFLKTIVYDNNSASNLGKALSLPNYWVNADSNNNNSPGIIYGTILAYSSSGYAHLTAWASAYNQLYSGFNGYNITKFPVRCVRHL